MVVRKFRVLLLDIPFPTVRIKEQQGSPIMKDSIASPILAVLIGTLAGFAFVVPFGGYAAKSAKSIEPGIEVRCDIMGCKNLR
jgi:hypothetical protein